MAQKFFLVPGDELLLGAPVAQPGEGDKILFDNPFRTLHHVYCPSSTQPLTAIRIYSAKISGIGSRPVKEIRKARQDHTCLRMNFNIFNYLTG